MKVHNVTQGSAEWLELRAKYFTASEAPAMLGLSKYLTRAELLRQKATGIAPEIDAATQARFDAGHAAEAATRAWAEEFIGEDLFPTTGTAEVDGLKLLASFDGLTMDESVNWENKLWNEDFAEMVRHSQVPDTHWPQMEHQMIVSGARKVLFTVSDGEQIEYMWYAYQPERRAKVLAGWKMFAEDLANYQHVEVKSEAVGRAPDQLPALRIEVTGMVTASNLVEFKETALAVFRGINTNLQTDQDFADAEKAVKFCKDAEERLEAAKSHALSQTASIDELFRTIDAIKEEARTVRLRLDKLVKAEKDNRKAEIVTNARIILGEHIEKLNARIGGDWMPRQNGALFAEAIKGLKTLDSMRDKIGAALAIAKIEANEIADRIEANAKLLKTDTQDFRHLFPDFAQVCTKPTEDFELLVGNRFAVWVEEQNKIRERIRREEQVKAEADARAKRDAELADEMAGQKAAKANAEQDERERIRKEAEAKSQPIDASAAVIEHQDEIGAFMATREWGKDSGRIRAVLVEFIKWRASRKIRRT